MPFLTTMPLFWQKKPVKVLKKIKNGLSELPTLKKTDFKIITSDMFSPLLTVKQIEYEQALAKQIAIRHLPPNDNKALGKTTPVKNAQATIWQHEVPHLTRLVQTQLAPAMEKKVKAMAAVASQITTIPDGFSFNNWALAEMPRPTVQWLQRFFKELQQIGYQPYIKVDAAANGHVHSLISNGMYLPHLETPIHLHQFYDPEIFAKTENGHTTVKRLFRGILAATAVKSGTTVTQRYPVIQFTKRDNQLIEADIDIKTPTLQLDARLNEFSTALSQIVTGNKRNRAIPRITLLDEKSKPVVIKHKSNNHAPFLRALYKSLNAIN